MSENSNPIALSYNSNGVIQLQLPQGSESNSYKISLFVNIIDDTQGIAVYKLNDLVQVWPNYQYTSSNIYESITNNGQSSLVLTQLNSGNLDLVAKNAISMSSVLNSQSSLSNDTSIATNQMASVREFLASKVNSLSVSDMSSIKVMSSTLSALTQTPQQVSTSLAVRILV